MCADIMRSVAGRYTPVGRAVLPGFACLRVRDETYPAIVIRADASTEGVVYKDLDEYAFERLDAFEGEMYNRVPVTVTLATGTLEVYTYVFKSSFSHRLTDAPWRLDEFLRSGKAAFLDAYVGFSKIREQRKSEE